LLQADDLGLGYRTLVEEHRNFTDEVKRIVAAVSDGL
jgi:hypothetical protein